MFPINQSEVRPHKQNAALTDLLLVIGVCVAGTFIFHRFDWFEALFAFSRRYEAYRFDDFLIIIAFVALGATYFSARRFLEIRQKEVERAAAERRMEALALTDSLTGLPNRRQFYCNLNRRLHSGTASSSLAVVMLDLDRFKPVNDAFGHSVGDQLLQQISTRAQDLLRPGDLLARLGGDEFGIVVNTSGVDDNLSALAERLLTALSEPFEIDQYVCHISASIGIASIAGDETADDLIRKADVALYRAKTEGKGTFRHFEATMDAKMRERTAVELDLRHALERNEICPYYQPLVCLRDGHVEGYEVLARWIHPTRGMVSPDVFIPISEDIGLIGDISLSLLERACLHARDWPEGTYLSFNISPVQFRDPDLCDKIFAVLERTGFPATSLEIEITENALAHDVATARAMLLALKAKGIRLAMDDFGTGYSSLQHLRTLPFDKLKIDRSFIISMSDSSESRKIVKAIVAMSHSLGLKATAEGIETHAHALKLAQMGCETGQGYLFGWPAAETSETVLFDVA